MILRSQIDYETIAKSSTAGPRAFVQSTKHLVTNMANSFRKRQEIEGFYGRADLGVVSTAVTTLLTFTAATYAPGIWSGTEGAQIEVLSADLGTIRGAFNISAADLSAKTITTDSATDFGSASVVATDRVFWKTARTTTAHKSALGVHDILSTTTGTVFGINVSNTLWQGNSVAAGGVALIMDVVQEAVARITEKGGGEGRLCLYVSNDTWVDLINDLEALKRFTKADGTSRYNAGAEAITFWTQSGPVEIKPSIFVKGGFAYLLDLGSWSRIGAQDFAFGDPAERQVFHRLESKSGYDARAYSNQSMFCDAIGHNAIITGIVNNT